jgi:hypothetical protein
MIAKGTTHNNGAKLASYMSTAKEGERAELWQLRGFEATTIKDAFRDVEIMADGTKCEQPFFHVQVRNRDGETLTREQWEYTANRIERMLGLTGQPRAIAFHTYEQTGHEHMHIAWSRIDEDTLTAKPLPFFKERLKKISRELELHFALEPVKNEREGRIKYAPTKAQDEQARRLGVDIHEVRNAIRQCYDRSDCGRSFQAALEHENLILAKGEQRDFIVIDHAGGMHALGKRILDVSAAKIRARFSDLDRENLPSVEEVRAFVGELTIEKQQSKSSAARERERDSATVSDQIQWEDALANAAIAKERTERQFVEPKERREQGAGRRKENHWPINPPQPERKSPEVFEQAATDATRDIRPEDLKGVAAKIWELWTKVDRDKQTKSFDALQASATPFSVRTDPKAFAAALDDKGIMFARATKEEAERSHREASFANAVGNRALRFKEGEIVVITERPIEYSAHLPGRGRAGAPDHASIERKGRIHKIDQSLARKFTEPFVKASGLDDGLRSIDATFSLSEQRLQKRREDQLKEREKRATDKPLSLAVSDFSIKDLRDPKSKLRRTLGKNTSATVRKAGRGAEKVVAAEVTLGKAAGPVGAVAEKVFDVVAGMMDSLFTTTPEQALEADKSKARRDAHADDHIEFSRYTGDQAQQNRNQQEQQAARDRQREHDGGGRER